MSMNIPSCFIKYLKSYELDEMDVDREDDLYLVAIEVLTKGCTEDEQELLALFGETRLRQLFVDKQGRSMDEEQRQNIRRRFDLSEQQIPKRFYKAWR